MIYRIKIITYKNGRKEFIPQVKKSLFWYGLGYYGEPCLIDHYRCDTREGALARIDKHFDGNSKVYDIYFEYIIK
jgi:hypothetical protein